MGYFFGSSEKEKKKKKKKKEKAEEVEEEDEFLQNLEGIREAKPKSKNQTAAAADVEKAKDAKPTADEEAKGAAEKDKEEEGDKPHSEAKVEDQKDAAPLGATQNA